MVFPVCLFFLVVGFGAIGYSPVWAATHVVAPYGDDEAVGNSTYPLKTISEAAERAISGDTVLVKAGVYRERVSPPRGGQPGKAITYRGEQLGKVFIKGSDIWKPDWRQHKSTVFFAAADKALFNDQAYIDSGVDIEKVDTTVWEKVGAYAAATSIYWNKRKQLPF